ncbi:hypothetical protein Moror_11619 [Moniliophthora roreri MCA 2997]|uniref:Myosin-binding domain-containing protein n=1 Tax=Moniliophthora roreri (strain MCA 2997) TaxID=1381753 RepID=V2Y6Z1_MONRO|nr:hypothetical protein Moror_11619 [Moniliophthora roreri MCA 2997]
MAQPVFDDHPLEQYFREEAGEALRMMPGGLAEFMPEEEDAEVELEELELDIHPSLLQLNDLYESLISCFSSQSSTALVERFKYSVISSSLLSTSLNPTQTHRRYSSDIPGNLHSRSSSVDHTETNTHLSTSISTHSLESPFQYFISSLALALVTISFRAGYYGISALICALLLYILMTDSPTKHAMTPSLNALSDLISAGNVWDSLVQEVMTTLEKDEKRMIYSSGLTIPSSPSTSLRLALHTTLLTTQNQCDNVRQLLSALASQSELAQLSEMYAPPSPHSTPQLGQGPRPFSLPNRRRRSSSLTKTSKGDKRATWNGSYASLANAGSPTTQILKMREKRRSDLSALLQATTSPKSASAPVTPSGEYGLEGVAEAESEEEEEGTNTRGAQEREQFGFAALELQRQRKLGGLETLGVPKTPQRQSFIPKTNPNYSTLATHTHPLSLSALHTALANAISSKRYSCSHLLALRFNDEEVDYWENVRSVMELLTTTFVDASSRLEEALEEAERIRLGDEVPTPLPEGEGAVEKEEGVFERQQKQKRRSSLGKVSFAPMPSHLSRFATHVDAISTALCDARECLEECVQKLKEGENADADTQNARSPSPSPFDASESSSVHPALQAYERLRRELGLALRECERGRERLLDVVRPAQSHSDEEDDIPDLGHEQDGDGSEESDDKPDSMESQYDVPHSQPMVVNPDNTHTMDDATTHLILSAGTEHLPPPGIEQVFEGDSGNVGVFTRERSKLSREERIAMVKKARESGQSLRTLGIRLPEPEEHTKLGVEQWGPGGEVVQELKDVIWKVGEKRRKMASEAGTDHRPQPQLLHMTGAG